MSKSVFMLSFLALLSIISGVCASSKVDIGIILDSSGSVGLKQFELAKSAIKYLVDKLNIGPEAVHFGLINYHSTSKIVQGFNPAEQDKQLIKDKIDALKYVGGTTSTSKALYKARFTLFNQMRDKDVPRIAVILTDGSSNEGFVSVNREAHELKQMNIHLISVGIGSDVNDKELEAIASDLNSILRPTNNQFIEQFVDFIIQFILGNPNKVIDFPLGVYKDIQVGLNEMKIYSLNTKNVDPTSSYIEVTVVEKSGQVSINFEGPTNPSRQDVISKQSPARVDTYFWMLEGYFDKVYFTIEGFEPKSVVSVQVNLITI